MELAVAEQTLLAIYRPLDDDGKKEMLRHASQQHKMAASFGGITPSTGQCKLERGDERPEAAAEPIFTE